MGPLTDADNQALGDLIRQRTTGYSLAGAFYKSELVYRAELERIWRRGWLFVGHTCEIPAPGDYITFAVDSDSLIVMRDDEGRIHAFWNVCTHRGTELCDQPQGKVGRLVCPYHQWTFGRDGSLLSCRGMQPELDKSQLSLRQTHACELEGLIFVSLSETPPDFDAAKESLTGFVEPQGLERARVAKIVDYDVAANWKIVWENNRECYHCNVNHPQYIKANFDHFNADDANERVQTRMADAVQRSEAKWQAAGLAVSHRATGMTEFPHTGPGGWFSANRTALVEGWVSETMDGRQAAPLMGGYQDADVGTLRIRTLPNMWNHSSCDHAVSTRLLPAGRLRTKVRVTWLVHEDAVEGRDYRLEDIMPFWQLTSEQDWVLCERAQRGINSSGYRPGPYSTFKEYNVDAFIRWYLNQLGANGPTPPCR